MPVACGRPSPLRVPEPFSQSVATLGPVFPTQYSGFRVEKSGSMIELCMVATADAPAGMGGQVRVQKNGVTYALYLVETTDPNSSPVRVQTATGIKAVRLKT